MIVAVAALAAAVLLVLVRGEIAERRYQQERKYLLAALVSRTPAEYARVVKDTVPESRADPTPAKPRIDAIGL